MFCISGFIAIGGTVEGTVLYCAVVFYIVLWSLVLYCAVLFSLIMGIKRKLNAFVANDTTEQHRTAQNMSNRLTKTDLGQHHPSPNTCPNNAKPCDTF